MGNTLYRCKTKIVFLAGLKKLLPTLLICFFIQHCNAQNKFEISTGIGIPDLINLGVEYNFSRHLQSGIKVGSLPFLGNEKIISLIGNFTYYYTGHSEYTEQPTWYFQSGISYFYDKYIDITEFILLSLRHGRVFNFSENLGLKIEIGIGIGLYYNEIKEASYYTYTSNEEYKPLLPSGCLVLFYRL